MTERARAMVALAGAEGSARSIAAAPVSGALVEAQWAINELLGGEGEYESEDEGEYLRWLAAEQQGHGGTRAIERKRDGAWIELSAELVAAPIPLSAIARNGELGGFAKYALAPRARRVHVRAELPTDVDGALGRRRRDTEAAIAKVDGGRRWPTGPGETRPEALGPGALAELCDVAGWPRVAVDAHALTVDLGLRKLGVHARIVSARHPGTVRVAVELDTIPLPIAEPCGTALAVFLLRAAAVVRLVRPVCVERDGRVAIVGFEVVYATPPNARELAHALAALRVAVEMTSREVAVLARDPAIARAYLALNEPPSRADSAGSAPTTSATLGKGEA